MLVCSTGGLKSRTTMEEEGASSLKTALASRRMRGAPCSGSSTTARSRLKTTGLRLGRDGEMERGRERGCLRLLHYLASILLYFCMHSTRQ